MSVFQPLVIKSGRRRELPASDTIHLPSVQLTDGATVTIDAATGKSFYLETAASRTLAMSGAGQDMQQIVIRIKNTSVGSITPILDTGANNKFRFGSDFPAIPAIGAGKDFYFTAIYNLPALRWDCLAKSGEF